MSNKTVYIVGGKRTPIGSFQGALSDVSAPELGATAISAILADTKIAAANINEVIMGCVLPAGIGQAPARQAAKKAGIPDSVGALTINKVCGSGLKAVMMASTSIKADEADVIIAGGMESMSQAPYYLKTARNGFRMGNQQAIDGMIYDGLWDPYNDVHMGNCAEQCVNKYKFSREDQDAYAALSYERAQKAIADGAFKAEIAPVSVPQRKGDPLIVDSDEEPGRGNVAKLPSLKPAFDKNGSVTAGNASSINDGAAALLIASEQGVKNNGLTPVAKIMGYTTHSQDPLWFTTAPVGAIEKLLQKLDWQVADVDLFEINEAFAAVVMAAESDLKIPREKINIRGGAVALGHPIGASGARVLITLLHALKDTGKKRGVASLCIGGGEAVALAVELV
ncbi:MAG: thiolase family protein [Vampirovibrionales bacterium]|nr:thiolase family protein [Vampirovibrionales bacterium]